MAEARPGRAEGAGASENKTSEVGVPKPGGFRKGISERVSCRWELLQPDICSAAARISGYVLFA